MSGHAPSATAHRARARRVALCAVLFLATAAGSPRQARADDAYDAFNAFAAANFGPTGEEEMTRHFGADLALVPAGDWVHASERSAVVAWETSLPARGQVEFGPTPAYGSTTGLDERPFFLHVSYLRDLTPGATYHYRLVATDERGRTVRSPDRTLAPRAVAGARHVPEDLPGGPPYNLTQANTTYIVTADLVAPGTAFNVGASGITLDLGGHTVTYNEVAGAADPPPPGGDYGWYATQNPVGIRTVDGALLRILNGTVRQGAGGGASDPAGYNPLILRRPRDTEVAGVTLDYYGAQITGLLFHNLYAGIRVHHNVVVDRGTAVINRHTGLDAIGGLLAPDGATAEADHNLVKRVRHRGIAVRSNVDVHDNEIYVDSWATNSYGVIYYSSDASRPVYNVRLRGNRVFGTGYHPIGLGSGYHAHDIQVTGNYIQMQAQAPTDDRWHGGVGGGDPPGQLHPVNGFRYHEGPQRDVLVADNTIVAKARGVPEEPALARGLWVIPAGGTDNVLFRLNRVKQVAQNADADGYALAALGTAPDDEGLDIRYEQNTFLSNTTNIQFGDNYGHGGKHHFVDTTLVRLGNDPRYRSFRLGWQGWQYSSYGHSLLDSRFEGGAGYDLVSFDGATSGRYDLTVLWRLYLTTSAGAAVSIQNARGETVYEGQLAAGEAMIPLIQQLLQRSDPTLHTPHRVTVTYPGQVPVVEALTMDRPRYLTVLAGLPPATGTPAASPVPTAATIAPGAASPTTMPAATPSAPAPTARPTDTSTASPPRHAAWLPIARRP